MRALILGAPVALALMTLVFWAAAPLIGRPRLDMPPIPARSAP